MFVGTDSASVVVNPANLTVRADNEISFGLIRGFGGENEHEGTFEAFVAPSFSLAAAQTRRLPLDGDGAGPSSGAHQFSAQAGHAVTSWLSLGVGGRLAKVERSSPEAPDDDLDDAAWTVDAGALLRLLDDRLRIDGHVANLREDRLDTETLDPTVVVRAQWVSPTGLRIGAGAERVVPGWQVGDPGPTSVLLGLENRFLDERLRLRAGFRRGVVGADGQRLSVGLGYGFGAVGESAMAPIVRTVLRLVSGLHLDYAVVFDGPGSGEQDARTASRQVVTLGKHF